MIIIPHSPERFRHTGLIDRLTVPLMQPVDLFPDQFVIFGWNIAPKIHLVRMPVMIRVGDRVTDTAAGCMADAAAGDVSDTTADRSADTVTHAHCSVRNLGSAGKV